jgi:hypothetical protein
LIGPIVARWTVWPSAHLILAAALTLGACTASPTPEVATAATMAAPSPSAPVLAAVPPESPKPARPEEEPLPDVNRLIGLKAEDVTALLGAPGFRRKDAPAEIWQYGDTSCTLDLFLYTDKTAAAPYTVTHIEVRRRALEAVSREECFRRLLKARRAERSS